MRCDAHAAFLQPLACAERYCVRITSASARCLTVLMTEELPNADGVPAETPADTIVCVDCGGVAHLITQAPEDNLWVVGDIATYRCSDCLDRWDLVLEESR